MEFIINEKYSYPQICRIKKEEIRRGNSKHKHIREWCVTEKWLKDDVGFIYLGKKNKDEIELAELDTTYSKLLEYFMFAYLGSLIGNSTTMTLSKFAETMALRNKNYSYGKYNKYDIIDLIANDTLVPINNEDISYDIISSFFDKNDSNCNRKIKECLFKMEQMGLISYTKTLYLANTSKYFAKIRATSEQQKRLLDIGNTFISKLPDREVVNKEDGTISIEKADKTNLTDKEHYLFYKKVPNIFLKTLNNNSNCHIGYYYYEYDIILSQDAINQHIPYKLENIKKSINSKIQTNLRNNGTYETLLNWFIDIQTDIDIRKLILEHRENLTT